MSQETEEPLYVLAFDTEKVAVGCVILQAAFGCDSRLVHELGFDPSSWLVAPTDGLRRIRGTRQQWEQAAKMANARWQGQHAQ